MHQQGGVKMTIFRFAAAILPLLAMLFASPLPARAADGPPEWAYPITPPNLKPAPDDGVPRRVPNSSATYTLTQIRDRFIAPVWHPEDHPPLPPVVAKGRKPDVFACGFCHRADGPGGPENAGLAGLPASYIKQQMADFKNGTRKTSVPERGPPQLMIALAKAASDEEVQASAEYFAALKPSPRIKVVETSTVPKTYVAGWFLADANNGEREPIGSRIIEVPEDVVQFENRDARSRFIAYVPAGSIKQGGDFAAKGSAGPTTQCIVCHGPGLKGLADVPGIAGRSPSYIVRQLYDFKHGARTGSGSELMKPVVETLTLDNMLALAAY